MPRAAYPDLCRAPNYAEQIGSVALLSHCCSALCEHLLRSIRHSCLLQRLEESEQAVIRLETRSLAPVVRLELRQSRVLECKVSVQIGLRGLHGQATE
jgi:hypothetical protein